MVLTDLKICWLPLASICLLFGFPVEILRFVVTLLFVIDATWFMWFPVALWMMWETHKRDYS